MSYRLAPHVLCAVLALAAQSAAAGIVVDANAGKALGELTTVAASRHEVFDVISSADLRRAMDFEAERQSTGCTEESTSCLADVAGAMGARFVVFGQVAILGSQIVLPLNLFDSQTSSSIKRVVIRATSMDELLNRIDGAMDELLAPAVKEARASKERPRLLLMDLELPKPNAANAANAGGAQVTSAAPAAVPVEEKSSAGVWMLGGGSGIALVGGLLVGGGALAGLQAQAADVAARGERFQDAAIKSYGQRDLMAGVANSLFIGGAVVVTSGVGLAAAAPFFWE